MGTETAIYSHRAKIVSTTSKFKQNKSHFAPNPEHPGPCSRPMPPAFVAPTLPQILYRPPDRGCWLSPGHARISGVSLRTVSSSYEPPHPRPLSPEKTGARGARQTDGTTTTLTARPNPTHRATSPVDMQRAILPMEPIRPLAHPCYHRSVGFQHPNAAAWSRTGCTMACLDSSLFWSRARSYHPMPRPGDWFQHG